MGILNFSDVLKNAGLDPKEVKLIRHTLSKAGCRDCYEVGKLFEYTCHQGKGFAKRQPYWIVFIGEDGTKARLYACYHVRGSIPDTPDVCPAGVPDCERKTYTGKAALFDLEPIDLLRDYEGKLVIDWGQSARMWGQNGTTPKPIVAIDSATKKPFPGFESSQFILPFDRLKEVIENKTDYELWHTAMSAVNAVYLIVDTKTGSRYVGSTYGYDGLLGRWSVYVSTGGHGNNKGMIAHLKSENHSCHDLQFSVLQILSKSLPDNQIIDTETLWKKKLLTYEPFGMNQN